jgi:N-acetylmuramoyl-L-alanine amidase
MVLVAITLMDFDWTSGPQGRQGRFVLSGLTLIVAALNGISPLAAAVVSGVDVAANGVTLRFDEAVDGASAFMLDGPSRIAVDVAGAQAGGASASGGIVAQTRQGQFTPSTARIVFDLTSPAVVSGGSFAEDGRSLTLSLRPVSASAFSLASRSDRQSFSPPFGLRTGRNVELARNNVTVPLDPPPDRAAPRAPRISGARGTNRPLVVIDAGHGGHDAGALSSDGSRREKDAALAIAKAIRDELAASGRVRVAMTREDDRFLVLGDRREIARRLKADLFLSVHADSAPNASARGATVYTLSEVASDRVAAQLAAKENKADVLNGVDLGGENNDVSSILIDLARRETMNVSSAFAALLQREMSPMVPFKGEFHRFAGLIVLKAPDVPSVLLETGYISNEADMRLLFSRDYQRDIAVGVRRAVEAHFARRLAQR